MLPKFGWEYHWANKSFSPMGYAPALSCLKMMGLGYMDLKSKVTHKVEKSLRYHYIYRWGIRFYHNFDK